METIYTLVKELEEDHTHLGVLDHLRILIEITDEVGDDTDEGFAVYVRRYINSMEIAGTRKSEIFDDEEPAFKF